MPIPSQNDFFLPFMQLLSNGETLTRGQIIYRLGKGFNISEEELSEMSGNQFTIINRVAWCDVHLRKAGFVDKRQHHSDSTQDEFSITSLGIREMNKNPSELTVGYLRTFYSGKVHRGAGSDDTTSDAEVALYEKFEGLSDKFSVFHSVKWFAKEKSTIGEIDFLVAHPDYGVLVMEVKGGAIHVDKGRWYSGRFEIKDPCEQADRNRWALQDWLQTLVGTKNIRFSLFPAVAVPDARVGQDIHPSCPKNIFIDMTHMDNLEGRLIEIFEYWKQRKDQKNQYMDGKQAVQALVDLLIPSRTLRPRVAELFERERRKIEELTQRQYNILRVLRRYRRAAIVGGAGTGKTMLAMEKATQLADEGYRVLLLCFNKHLSEWMDSNLNHPNILISTFHGMVGRSRHWAGLSGSGRKMGWEEFREKAPEILLDALDIIRAPGGNADDVLFDAVIVDEAQDFEDEWWVVVPDLLKDAETGVFYVFFDDNQRIYTQISNIPMDTEPFDLDENCRNTQHVHATLEPYCKDDATCIGPEGRPVEIIPVENKQAERRELQRVLYRLVNEDGIAPEDIVILTPASEKRSQWKNDDQLGNFILTWDLETEMPMAGRVCTIYRYKGLENAVVILTELQHLHDDIRDQLLYVGLSRARHHVVVLGELPTPVS